ncbi:hypothetical protein NDA11_007396, partial [Ustilago hordei]
MTDPDLNNKLDRLLTLLEAQLELTRQGHREERLQQAQLSREETMDLSHSEDQAGGGDESMIGDPHTPTPAPRPRRSVSFNLDEQEDINYEKYASPTGPRYVKTKLDPYSRTRWTLTPWTTRRTPASWQSLTGQSPLPPLSKVQSRDMEIFILEAEAWFKFNQVYEQSRMINHMVLNWKGQQESGGPPSSVLIELEKEGCSMIGTTSQSDCQSKRFRDLEGQVNLDDNELVIDLFRGSLTQHTGEVREESTWEEMGVVSRDLGLGQIKQGSPAPSGYGHHSRPLRGGHHSGDGHTGSTETGDPEAMDLSSYQQPMDPDHEEEDMMMMTMRETPLCSIAKPLTALVKPIERFKKLELPEEAQQAFHKLIQAFTSAGVLQHFDYHLPTRLETDASDFAIAGVLKQEHEGRWHPVAFYSRKMSSAEKNYEIHDKELLAVVACLTQWRHMLAGLPNQLVILTDHEALKYFKSQRRITGRQARWAILLADFDFILQYRPGDKGGEPDALTRRTDMQPAGEEQDHNVRQLLPPRVFKETADHDSLLVAPMISMESIASKGLKDLVKIFQPLDQELQEIHRKKPFELKDDLWYSGGRLVIPKVIMPGRTNNRHSRSAKEVDGQSLSVGHLRFMVMTQCHDGITAAGHVGRDATIKAAQRHYWWPNMTAWIADYVASCP